MQSGRLKEWRWLRRKVVTVVAEQEIEVSRVTEHVLSMSIKPYQGIVYHGHSTFRQFVKANALQLSVGISVGCSKVAAVGERQFHVLLVGQLELDIG